MNDTEVAELVAQLDEQVAREDAVVKPEQYGGGPDESCIVANRAGYLRFGIEFLKAALAPPMNPDGKAPFDIEVDLDYLVSEDSTVNFIIFERREEFATPEQADNKWNNVFHVGCVVVIMFGIILCIVGAASLGIAGMQTIIEWLS